MKFFFKRNVPIQPLYEGFVDCHCHILPGIDDGAKDPDMSLRLIDGLMELGFSGFVATPHIMKDVYPNDSATIASASSILQDAMSDHRYEKIFRRAAAEHMLDENFEVLLDKREIMPLKDNYVLVEMSYYRPPQNMELLIFKMLNMGYKPVLAHPERYNFIQKQTEYKKLLNKGCLFQLNLLSLSDHYGEHVQSKAYKLLDAGHYMFAGTDIHHDRHLQSLSSLSVPKPLYKKLEEVMQHNLILS